MRIVALHAIHSPFQHGMVLRQLQLRVDVNVAGEARLRFATRIDDELAAATTGFHMQAAWPMTGLAAGVLFAGNTFEMQPRVRTRRKRPREIAMTFVTSFVPNKRRSFDLRWRHDCALDTGTGSQNEDGHPKASRYH